MQQEKRKRGRDSRSLSTEEELQEEEEEEEEEEEKPYNYSCIPQRTRKKARDEENQRWHHEREANKEDCDVDDDIFKGVFDFPWLKEGMLLSASEENDVWAFEFEGTFLSSLGEDAISRDSRVELFNQGTPWITTSLPEDKVDLEREWTFRGDKLDSFDCIWSSLLNQTQVE
ncbi:hypothetical protein CDL15_Pgr029094 [Punica granatum]|uniref:Uncharacterized protein n=1 Tax=Punica granatum TaxID=22663 RepID=A0A218XMG8_PUNGR|nr:hypothetical protein CDL15_Pgr029094 [Punica granatum]PKI71455.1 hypothetical protein CRG98_008128 [Punica granatum]